MVLKKKTNSWITSKNKSVQVVEREDKICDNCNYDIRSNSHQVLCKK